MIVLWVTQQAQGCGVLQSSDSAWCLQFQLKDKKASVRNEKGGEGDAAVWGTGVHRHRDPEQRLGRYQGLCVFNPGDL